MFLDIRHLRAYIDTFIGYGDYHAKYWLIGMEEGGGGTFDEVSRRLARWDASGRPELLDLRDHHQEGDLTSFVSGSGDLQTTWSQLIRIVLASEGKPTDNESVRTYQQHLLGRYGGETSLLELMPLPSPDVYAWHYSKWSLLPDLRNRKAYMKRYADSRANLLHGRILEHQPPVVVFYSLSYKGWWEQIAGVALKPVPIGGVKSFSGANEHTDFVVVPQPAAFIKGKGNDYYVQVGKAISASLRAKDTDRNV